MILNHELIAKIKDYFDLNVYETKVWLALLGKGVAAAGEIASISGVPRSRTYDVLETLEKRGFAIVKLGKPVKYIGVKPKAVLEKIKANVQRNAEERVAILSKISGTEEFTKLEEIYKESVNPIKREDISASLKGKSNISNYLREILENAEKEVIMCTNANDISAKLKLFKQTIDLLQKADIKIKMALSGEDALIKSLSEKLGLKIKKVKIDAKFFIIDRKEILFYLSKDSEGEDLAVWLDSEFFSNAFATLFEKAMEEK